MRPEQILDVGDRAGSRHRHLHVIRKTGPTPADLPRSPASPRSAPRAELSCEPSSDSRQESTPPVKRRPAWRPAKPPPQSRSRARSGSPPPRQTYRRFFFFFGGGGGGFAAAIAAAPSGVAATGTGMIFWITNCWPIVQMLVVIQ